MGLVEVHMREWLARGTVIAILGWSAVGCGGGGDDDAGGGACSTPKVTGSASVFFDGTATLKGTGTMAPGPADGHELELLIDGPDTSESIFPDGVSRIPTVCGSTFSYEITQLAAGTYTLTYEIYDPNDYTTPTFTATSNSSVTVADGATVAFDPTF
jgi:hypothetical protein